MRIENFSHSVINYLSTPFFTLQEKINNIFQSNVLYQTNTISKKNYTKLRATESFKFIFLIPFIGNFIFRLYHFFSPLIDEKKSILSKMATNPEAFHEASNSLQEDPSFIFDAIKVNPDILKYIKKNFVENSDFMLSAIKIDPKAARYASVDLQQNKLFLMNALEIAFETSNYFLNNPLNSIDFLLFTMEKDPKNIKFASAKFRNNPDFMLNAIEINYETIRFASSELRNNPDFMLDAIKINYETIRFASLELRDNPDFMLDAIEINYETIQFASIYLRLNRSFIIKASNINGLILEHATSFSNDPFIVFSAVKKNPQAVIYAAEELQESCVLLDIISDSFLNYYKKTEPTKTPSVTETPNLFQRLYSCTIKPFHDTHALNQLFKLESPPEN